MTRLVEQEQSIGRELVRQQEIAGSRIWLPLLSESLDAVEPF